VVEDLERSGEAEPLYLESLELCRKSYGAEHPQTAFALDNLALHFTAMGDAQRAEPLFRESLAMLQKVYGAEHPEVAQTMGNLADFLAYDKGPSAIGTPADFEEAEALHRKALAMNRRIRPDHPYLGDNLAALAALRHIAGDDREAERLMREALRIYRLKLGEEHAKIVDAKWRLGDILRALGRPKEAESLLLECHRVLEASSSGSKTLEGVRRSLAGLYRSLGKPELAAQYDASKQQSVAVE
jgi:tetratricopeptide (TPR) repeat protein